MKVGKPKSKRVSVRLRHKIQKASASKQRKARKEGKKNPEWKSKLKKDPGIPNLFPYKDKLLHEIEEGKKRKEEETLRRREEAKANRQTVAVAGGDVAMEGAEEEDNEDGLLDYDSNEEDEAMDTGDSSNPMAALLASARARAAQFDNEGDEELIDSDSDASSEDDEDTSNATARQLPKDSSRRAFDKVFKETLSASDVILYILDARDPLGTRSRDVELAVTADPSKRLILILNKIDLVPARVLAGWLKHLRRSFPTLPLRAAGAPAPGARTFDHKRLTAPATANALVKALKSYAAHKDFKRSIRVGIIGYPNVGKSSVVNALTSRLGGRSGACPVGAEAGVTTSMREVKLDGKIKLLDSPGIVFPSADPSASSTSNGRDSKIEAQARLILLNALPPREITDPVPAVSLLLRRLSATPELFEKLLTVYALPPLMMTAGKDLTTDFLVQVARKRGRLGRGGVPNLHAAAQTVVGDWRDGRIQGWVEAPVLAVEKDGDAASSAAASGAVGLPAESAAEPEKMADQKVIVTEWAKEFKIEGLWGDEEVVQDEAELAGGDVVMAA